MYQERLVRPVSNVLEDGLPARLVDINDVKVHAAVALLAAAGNEPAQVRLLVGAGARDPGILDAIERGVGALLAFLGRAQVEDAPDAEFPAQHRPPIVGQVAERPGAVREPRSQRAARHQPQVPRVEGPIHVDEGRADEHRPVLLLRYLPRHLRLGEFKEVGSSASHDVYSLCLNTRLGPRSKEACQCI